MGMASTTVHGTSSSFGGSLTAYRYAVCGIKVQGREATRSRKFIQFLRKKLLYIEPTLNVFHRKRNYYRGILLALHHESDGLALLATEAALTQTVRPELNYPWVQDTMNALRIKQVRYRLPQARTGLRHVRKAHALVRRQHGAYHFHIECFSFVVSLGK